MVQQCWTTYRSLLRHSDEERFQSWVSLQQRRVVVRGPPRRSHRTRNASHKSNPRCWHSPDVLSVLPQVYVSPFDMWGGFPCLFWGFPCLFCVLSFCLSPAFFSPSPSFSLLRPAQLRRTIRDVGILPSQSEARSVTPSRRSTSRRSICADSLAGPPFLIRYFTDHGAGYFLGSPHPDPG